MSPRPEGKDPAELRLPQVPPSLAKNEGVEEEEAPDDTPEEARRARERAEEPGSSAASDGEPPEGFGENWRDEKARPHRGPRAPGN